MPEFEVVTGFYTIVPWLSGGLIIFGIVATVGLSILMGWYIGKNPKKKAANLWLGFGWILLFGVFAASVFTSTVIYQESRSLLRTQVQNVSNIEVITFIRDDTSAFIGKKDDGTLVSCRLIDKDKTNDIYVITCPPEGVK